MATVATLTGFLQFNAAKSYQDGRIAPVATVDVKIEPGNGSGGGFVNVAVPYSGLALAAPAAPTLATATTGGTLVPATYGYRVTGLNGQGETVASAEATIVVPAGTNTNVVTGTITALTGATSYRVYGRTAGGELLIASLGAGVTTFSDTGSATPSGALPTANTATLVASGAACTVVVTVP